MIQENTLQVGIKEFITYCDVDRGLSQHTVKAYRLDLKCFSAFFPSPSIPTDHGQIKSYLRSLSKFKPRTKNRKLATLKSFYRFLSEEEIILENPMNRIRSRAKIPNTLPKTITRDEAIRIIRLLHVEKTNSRNYYKSLRDAAVIETLFNTGMRVAELCNLSVKDVFLEEGFILVCGKGGKERTIPVCGEEYEELLREYLEERELHGDELGFLFLNRDSRRLSEQSVRRIVARYGSATKIIGLTPHVFRHSIATLLLEEGTDIRFIQRFLGHSSIVTTTIYASVRDRAHQEMIQSKHPRSLLLRN